MFVRISDKVSELTGNGLEYLTDALGNPIAAFYDGNLVTASSGNTVAACDDTVTSN